MTPFLQSTPDPALSRSEISNDYDSSNITPASGTDFNATIATSGFDSSGPWYIETQTLSVEYVRMPMQAFRDGITQNSDYALSGTWARYNGVSGTHRNLTLVCRVNANVKVVKSNDPFTTSAYSQPQILTVQAFNTDLNGVTYGGTGVSGVDVSGRLGCRGNLVTSQDFYNRRPWNATYDAELNESVMGAHNFYARSPSGGWENLDEDACMSDYRVWALGTGLNECGPKNHHGQVYDYFMQIGSTVYSTNMNFPYTPSNETMQSDKNLALWAANYCRNGFLYKAVYVDNDYAGGSNSNYNQSGRINGPNAGEYCPSYDVSRHSWS